MRNNPISLDLHDAIKLKKTKHSPYWQYYYKLAGRQFRQSTKTSDKFKAERIAYEAYEDTQRRIENGDCLDLVSFNKLSEQYIKTLQGQNKLTFHSETLNRHFKPFFGHFKDINKITKSDLLDYREFRKEKFRNSHGRELKPQSMNKECACFNQMMKHAHDRGWLKTVLKFDGLTERYSHSRRPHFNAEQYEALIKASSEQCNNLEAISLHKGINLIKNSKYTTAALLHDIIIILANSGMRVDEIKTVRWCHVDIEDCTIKLHRAGKTRNVRSLALRPDAVTSLQNLKERRMQ